MSLSVYATKVTADAVDKSSPSFANPAVAHSCKTWKKTFRDALGAGESEVRAAIEAAEAYRAAMPALSSRESCRDFIACVAQGILLGAISEKDGGKLLYAAQVALAAVNSERSSANASESREDLPVSAARRGRKLEDKRR
ncbi:MAG: hypothetical protein ACLPLZ_14970 [Terracidiphilus sp.]